MADAKNGQADSHQPRTFGRPEHHADPRKRKQDEERQPVPQRKEVVNGKAARREQCEAKKGLAFELEPIDQRDRTTNWPKTTKNWRRFTSEASEASGLRPL